MRSRNYLILLGIVFIGFSCSSVKITPLNQAKKYSKNSFVYQLPKTIVKVEVEAKKTTYYKGQYSEFALEYLGIENAITENKIGWEITGIQMESIADADTQQFYLVKPVCLLNKFQLNEKGIICGINLEDFKAEDKANNTFSNIIHEPEFIENTASCVKKIFDIESDTVFKKQRIDSVYVRVPVVSTEIIKKDLQQRAKDAADFIIRLRKRRFKLVAGINEKVSATASIQAMVEELNREEKEIIEHFTGNKISQTVKKTYYFTPNIAVNEPSVLFRFSDSKGFDETNDEYAVSISAIKNDNTKSVSAYYSKNTSKKPVSGLFYRIPENAKIQILDGENIMAESEMQIAQYGIINALPRSVIKKSEIKFDSKTGNILSVSRKKKK